MPTSYTPHISIRRRLQVAAWVAGDVVRHASPATANVQDLGAGAQVQLVSHRLTSDTELTGGYKVVPQFVS